MGQILSRPGMMEGFVLQGDLKMSKIEEVPELRCRGKTCSRGPREQGRQGVTGESSPVISPCVYLC